MVQRGWRILTAPLGTNQTGVYGYKWDVVWQFGAGRQDYREQGGDSGVTDTEADAQAAAAHAKLRLEREQPNGPAPRS